MAYIVLVMDVLAMYVSLLILSFEDFLVLCSGCVSSEDLCSIAKFKMYW